MSELKVISKKYNDADILVIEDKDVVGLLEGQDIKAKTLKQSEPNFSLNFASVVPTVFDTEHNQYTPLYCRFEEINNILFIVWNFKIKNLRDYDAGANWLRLRVTLPEEIADKIYDISGKKVSESSGNPISSDILFFGSVDYPASIGTRRMTYSLANTTTVNELEINAYIGDSLKSGADTSFTGRTFLTLI